jgi:uncharacterized protein YjlB
MAQRLFTRSVAASASFEDMLHAPQMTTHLLTDDGIFPNNATLPLIVYSQAVTLPTRDAAAVFETMFEAHQWGNGWRNGIYGVHHYHSTAHEVLGIFRGQATVQCGGEHGVILQVQRGDVVVIPAGVAHKNLGSSGDFGVVGAYPWGQRWDTCYGKAGERPRTDDNIARVALPQADPVYGAPGPLMQSWHHSKMFGS